MAEAAIGSEISGHRLEAVAGRGGMGVVYKATQTKLNRTVALKLISADLAGDESFRERFEHESQIAAQIEHPNVIPLYEAGEADGQLYITMRYVEGTDVRALISREGALQPRIATEILAQVCGALDAAHERGLVHRDIKPANVLIAGTPEEPHAYLTDFGLTKQAATSSGMTKTGMFVGTLDYIAPEQLQGGPVDARADIYALGCMLYQMLTGRVPYPRDTEPAKIWAHMQEPPPSLREVAPQVPDAFDEVIARSMAKNAEDRYPSAGDLARAARAAVQDRQIGDTAERSVAAGPAAPQTQMGGGVPTDYGQQPGTYAGQGSQPWAQGTQGAGGYGGGPPTQGAQSYPTGPGGTAPAWGPQAPAKKSKTGLYALIGGTALAAIIAFVVVLALAGGGGSESNAAGEVTGEPIKIGKGPRDAAFGGGAIWTANLDDNTVTRVDPATNKTTNIPVSDLFPFEADFDGNNLYVTGPSEIRKIDPATNKVVGTYKDSEGEITSVAAGEGALWVVHSKNDTVTKVSQQTMTKDGDPIKVGDEPTSAAVGEGGVWVSNYADSSVTKVDPVSNDVFGQPIKLEFQPGGVSVVEGTIYVGTGKGVVEIDPTSFTLGEPVETRGAAFYDVGLGSLWTTFPNSGELKRLDLETKALVGDPIEVGKGVQGVAVGVRGVPDVWVLNTKAATITRVKP
jgi:tRNA A-37 threonylcarbamoyl transferase component Bud32